MLKIKLIEIHLKLEIRKCLNKNLTSCFKILEKGIVKASKKKNHY
jgi:hypothetical protein